MAIPGTTRTTSTYTPQQKTDLFQVGTQVAAAGADLASKNTGSGGSRVALKTTAGALSGGGTGAALGAKIGAIGFSLGPLGFITTGLGATLGAGIGALTGGGIAAAEATAAENDLTNQAALKKREVTRLQNLSRTQSRFKNVMNEEQIDQRATGGTYSYRRGGEHDLDKRNIIADGPSHDDLNNAGAGDKGLPIINNGKKVAEIESRELKINADAVKHIKELKIRAESGDKDAVKELGEFLTEELSSNTYDYTNELL